MSITGIITMVNISVNMPIGMAQIARRSLFIGNSSTFLASPVFLLASCNLHLYTYLLAMPAPMLCPDFLCQYRFGHLHSALHCSSVQKSLSISTFLCFRNICPQSLHLHFSIFLPSTSCSSASINIISLGHTGHLFCLRRSFILKIKVF